MLSWNVFSAHPRVRFLVIEVSDHRHARSKPWKWAPGDGIGLDCGGTILPESTAAPLLLQPGLHEVRPRLHSDRFHRNAFSCLDRLVPCSLMGTWSQGRHSGSGGRLRALRRCRCLHAREGWPGFVRDHMIIRSGCARRSSAGSTPRTRCPLASGPGASRGRMGAGSARTTPPGTGDVRVGHPSGTRVDRSATARWAGRTGGSDRWVETGGYGPAGRTEPGGARYETEESRP